MQTGVQNWHARSCWLLNFFFLFILCTNVSSAPTSWEALHELGSNTKLGTRLLRKLPDRQVQNELSEACESHSLAVTKAAGEEGGWPPRLLGGRGV